MGLLDEVVTDAEVTEAAEPRPVLPEGDYEFVVKEAGDDVSDKADASTGLVDGAKSVYAPLVLEVTTDDGTTAKVYHNQSVKSKAADPKKQAQIKSMYLRFNAALGLPADAVNQIESVKQYVGLSGRAHIGVQPKGTPIGGGKVSKRDRNQVEYFLQPGE